MIASPAPGARPNWDRRLLLLAAALVLAPVAYMLARGWAATRNVAYLDDIDGVLMLLVRLHDGGSVRDLFGWLFEVDNEHRMVTSRLMYVVSYWLTGTVNFAVFGAIGNLFVCGLCAVLVGTAGNAARKWTMALLLAGLLFQLQHFENFFWAGSAIDHFQVPLLAAVAFVLLARRTPWATAIAGGAAVLATFTLAHGVMLWPVGAVVLAVERRWSELTGWLAAAALAVGAFFAGFELNPAHRVGDLNGFGVLRIARYWLEVVGAPFAFGNEVLALMLGVVFVGWLALQLKQGGLQRERIAVPLALWAVAALAAMAVGRASLGSALQISRYYVLSGLAWGLAIFVELHARDRTAAPGRRSWWWLAAGLAVFNVAANLQFDAPARRWTEDRDEAVRSFVRSGQDGAGRATLHPLPQHATRVIRQAEALGVFEMPRDSEERAVPAAQPAARVSYAVDRVNASGGMVTIDGWAAVHGRATQPGDVEVVLQSGESLHVLTTCVVPRPDVAQAFPAEQWRGAGFHFAVRRWLLPPENFQVGLLVQTEHGRELQMTPHRIDLSAVATVDADKVAPNRLVYDELILRETSATVTASPKKFARVTFLDPHDGLVNVDFSGAGEMTVTLADATPLHPHLRDHGRLVAAMKGSATIAIAGADETTNVAIYAPRRQPISPNPRFDGLAHVASLSIASRNGRFGGVRAGNTVFAARSGIVGVAAAGVRFAGPVNVGDIAASGEATPKFELGFARETRVAGGSLRQPNGAPVQVSGVWRLRFVEGRTAMGERLPARENSAVLQYRGKDISARIVPAPGRMQAADEE